MTPVHAINLRSDPNHNLQGHIFPLILPLTREYHQGDLIQVRPKDAEPFQAQIIRGFPYPNIHQLEGGFLQLVSGDPDAEAVRERYIQHFQRKLNLQTTRFAVFLLAKSEP